jgi:hypothetical protein
MKEVLNFIVWQWQRLELWQKCYLFGASLFGAAVVAPEPYNLYLFAAPMTMLFVWLGKWWIWEPLTASWAKYKTEKKQLFDTIKDSDR